MKCEYCNSEHDGSFATGRFCNRSCACGFSTGHNRKEISKKVSNTLKGRKVHKEDCKCGFCECSRGNVPKSTIEKFKEGNRRRHEKNREVLIRNWRNKEAVGYKKNFYLKLAIRDYIFEKYDNKCARCGWDEINQVTGRPPLEIDHIDGDAENAWEDNLILLCPNCHALTPTWKALNKGNAKKDRYLYQYKEK